MNVDLATENSSVRIEVVDFGIGMTPEEAERALEIFYRVDSSMTAVGGFGLGLPVAGRSSKSMGAPWPSKAPTGKGRRSF